MLKVVDSLLQPIFNTPLRHPAYVRPGNGDIGLSFMRVVGSCRQRYDVGLRMRERFDLVRKIGDGVLFRVTQIDGQRVVAIHEANETMDKVIDKLKATRLRAITVNGNVLILERLDNKIGDDATVIGVHSWAKPVARDEKVHIPTYTK